MADVKCKLKTVLTLSGVANFLLLIVCFVTYVLRQNDQKDKINFNITSIKNDSVCISCDYLGKTVTKEDTLFTDIINTKCGHRICCMEEQSISSLLKMMLHLSKGNGRNRELYHQLKWWRERKHSAHLIIEKAVSRGGNLKWMTSDSNGIAFTNGIKYINNTMEVPETGIYVVYTSVVVDFSTEDKVPLIYHNVTTKHPKLPLSGSTLRLMNKHGGSSLSDKHYTSRLFGALYLQRGYQIETQISDVVYVTDDIYSSYFGMFKL